MAHAVFNGSEYAAQWGERSFPPRQRVNLTDSEFARLLARWQAGDPHGGTVTSHWGEWLPEMQQYLKDHPLDPMMLDVTGIGPARIMRLYQIGVCSMYDLAVADPVLVADHLEVSESEGAAMVQHVMKAECAPPAETETDPADF